MKALFMIHLVLRDFHEIERGKREAEQGRK
jgi:hypothetical protein